MYPPLFVHTKTVYTALSQRLGLFCVVVASVVLSGCTVLPASIMGRGEEASATATADTLAKVVEVAEEDSTFRVYTYEEGLEQYQPPARTYDLLHTSLHLKFDFPAERAEGVAVHKLTPLTDGLKELRFHAQDLSIQHVTMVVVEGIAVDTLAFDYDGQDLLIYPYVGLLHADTVQIRIAYTVEPQEDNGQSGLVFIDGEGIDPEYPTQVWTQGRPEDSRRWFPTWDLPNDFATYELILTVPGAFSTVANGVLLDSEDTSDGLRTDRWVLNKSHASHLTGFAVGIFDESEAMYTGLTNQEIPFQYFADVGKKEDAERMYPVFPQIFEAFEQRLGVPYPWETFKVVPLQGSAASQAEPSSASFLNSTLVPDHRSFPESAYKDELARSVAHQWFGSLVTAKDWANLAVPEGLVTYFEQVFAEQTEGEEEAQRHRIQWLETYLAEAERYQRPLIWYGYDDPEELVDAHTSEKAALVLDYLRYQLGEDAFWMGVQTFLRSHQHRPVGVDELQLAMELGSGFALRSFFDLWYREPGHPILEVIHTYDRRSRLYTVQVKQKQDRSRLPVYDFQADIELNFIAMAPFTQRVRIFSADTTFVFTVSAPVTFGRFDPGAHVPAPKVVRKTLLDWIEQARHDDEAEGRYAAVKALIPRKPTREVRDELVIRATEDPAMFIREAAAGGLAAYAKEPYVIQILQRIVNGTDHASVRSAALRSLAAAPRDQAVNALHAALQDPSYLVVNEAIGMMAKKFPDQAVTSFLSLYDSESWNHTIERTLIQAIVDMKRDEGIPYLLMKLDPRAPAALKESSARMLPGLVAEKQGFRLETTRRLLNLLDDPNDQVRLAVAEALRQIAGPDNLNRIESRFQKEPSQQIRKVLQEAIANLQPPTISPNSGSQ